MQLRNVPEFSLVIWGCLLNSVWEFAQSPLYTDHSRGAWYVIWTRLHCTGGDVMILLAAFWITSLVCRTRFWLRNPNPAAWLFFLSVGFGYTVLSECYHTNVSKAWEYTPSMPTLLGIGVTPLLQWLILPPIVALMIRRRLIHSLQTTNEKPSS